MWGEALEALQRGNAPGLSCSVVFFVVLGFDDEEKNMSFRVGQTWV